MKGKNMKTEFEVGDSVYACMEVTEQRQKEYDDVLGWNSYMADYLDKPGKIVKPYGDTAYTIRYPDGEDYTWFTEDLYDRIPSAATEQTEDRVLQIKESSYNLLLDMIEKNVDTDLTLRFANLLKGE